MRISTLFLTIVSFAFILFPNHSYAASLPILATHAKSAILYDESSKKVLYAKNANDVLPLASLTKIVAIYTFLQLHPSITSTVTYKNADEELNYLYCARGESGRLTLEEGDKVTVKDLIYSSLMMSTNNTVESLVRVSGISRDKFIAKMNSNVKAWGAKSTSFIEPTGLAPENVSTAHDYALITAKVFKNKTIRTASTRINYSFMTKNTHTKHQLTNVSTLVRNQEYTITAVKTGYLNEAAHCLMTRISTKKGPITAVVFGVPTSKQTLADMRGLLDYGTKLAAKKR